MSIEIIRDREHKEFTEYRMEYSWISKPNCGFTFPCDKAGNVDVESLSELAKESWNICQTNPEVKCDGIRKRVDEWTEPAVGRCHCGQEVILCSFTNTCDCGRDYNGSGTLLAARSQWGEETGETWRDCL